MVTTVARLTSHLNNLSDKFYVIGHVPKLMEMYLSKFFKATTEFMKGKHVN